MTPTLLLWPLPSMFVPQFSSHPAIFLSPIYIIILGFCIYKLLFHIPVSTLLHEQEEARSLLYTCSLALLCLHLTSHPLSLYTKPVFVHYLIPLNPSNEAPTIPTE